jgi:hypothetical protein
MSVRFRVGGSISSRRFAIKSPPTRWVVDKLRGPYCERCAPDLHIEWPDPRDGTASCRCLPAEQYAVELENDEL